MDNESRDINIEQGIDAYIKGDLSENEINELWIQLFKRPEYINQLETEIDLVRLYRAREEEYENNESSNFREQFQELKSGKEMVSWKWFMAMAAIAIILFVSIRLLTGNHKKSKWKQVKASAHVTLSKDLASAQVIRSAETISSADSLLNIGFKAALGGNSSKAMKIYRSMLNNFSEPQLRAKVHFNMGILQYKAGKYDDCIDNFKKAVPNLKHVNLIKERAYWYIGNAYLKQQEPVRARLAIYRAHKIGKIYAKEESILLKQLNHQLGIKKPDN